MELSTEHNDIYTVTRLNREVRHLLEECFPLLIRLQGEISNLVRPASDHLYFSLKDRHTQVRAVMFSGMNRLLAFTPENGTEVIVRAQISLYEGRGEFQLIVEHMELVGTGDLQRAYEALKQKLSREGLFDNAHKRSLPRFPETIGILSSPTGAAVRDVVSVLKRRYPIGKLIVYPIPVQGENAAQQITDMLACVVARHECDVLVITRGGGSIEDLWAFNNEALARAIAACPIPVVTGVGHEIDFTIADFVADARAPTPSAAAELISPDRQQLEHAVLNRHSRLVRWYEAKRLALTDRLSHLSKRLPYPMRRLHNDVQRLDSLTMQLQRAISDLRQSLRTRLQTATRSLHTISPLATLDRGYAIVHKHDDGRIVRTASQCLIGECIRVRLHTGEIVCTVDEVHETGAQR